MSSGDLVRKRLYDYQNLIELLMVARGSVQLCQDQLQRFRQDHRPPEMPESFDVRGLAIYVTEKEQHDARDGKFVSELDRAKKALTDTEREVAELLPEGVPLVYDFRTFGTQTSPGRYEIRTKRAGGDASIEVRLMESFQA